MIGEYTNHCVHIYQTLSGLYSRLHVPAKKKKLKCLLNLNPKQNNPVVDLKRQMKRKSDLTRNRK